MRNMNSQSEIVGLCNDAREILGGLQKKNIPIYGKISSYMFKIQKLHKNSLNE